MTAAPGESAILIRRAPRWMWVVLIVSLSINLLIAGMVLGRAWAIRNGYWDATAAIQRSYRFMSSLPLDQRREIRAIFFEHKPRLEPYWHDLRQARVRIGELIRGGSYTSDELNTAMDAMFQKELSARQAAKPMIDAMFAKLTPDQRVHFLRIFLPYLDNPQARNADLLQ